MRRKTAIYASGVLWFAIGCLLLYKGLRCIAAAGMFHETAMTWVAVGLLLGFIKGRFVLSKAVKRLVQRIAVLSPPHSMDKGLSSRLRGADRGHGSFRYGDSVFPSRVARHDRCGHRLSSHARRDALFSCGEPLCTTSKRLRGRPIITFKSVWPWHGFVQKVDIRIGAIS